MDVLAGIERLEEAVAVPRSSAGLGDADVASVVLQVADLFDASAPASDKDRERLVQLGFRLSADHPEWTLTPVAVTGAFDKLVREPRVIAAYKDGVPVEEIESKYGIAKSSLYALLAAEDITVTRSGSGRPRRLDHAAVRLEANDGVPVRDIAARHECAPRTVRRIINSARNPHVQAFIDRLSVVEPGELLRGAWNRYLDALSGTGERIAELSEPEWPTDPERRALAAAAIAYQFHYRDIGEPDWLQQPKLVSPILTSPVPEYIHIALPLTPPVVARYNVALDEDSFHSA